MFVALCANPEDGAATLAGHRAETLGVVPLAGECRVLVRGRSIAVPTCHMLVVPGEQVDQVVWGAPPLLVFHVEEVDAVLQHRLTPMLLDAIAMEVLMDVFVEHRRSKEHEAAALAFVCHQVADMEAAPRAPSQSGSFPERVERYLRDHLEETITMDALSACFGCSATHLTRRLQQRGKPSPIRLLGQLRMQRARDLLRQTDMPVSQVGAEVGFSDSATFSHFFKKHTGQSPSEYRKNVNWLL